MYSREQREKLKNLIQAIETGGGTWEFIPERLISWRSLYTHYYNDIAEKPFKIFIHMIEELNVIYGRMKYINHYSGQSLTLVDNSMTKEQKEVARSIKKNVENIKAGYKELNLMLGKVDEELMIDSAYRKFYRKHKPRSREIIV